MHSLFELDLHLPHPGSRTLLRELHRQMRTAIVAGRLKPGLKLPSTRSFAARFGISRNTALALYERLLSEGFLTARRGSGTFVAGTSRLSAPAATGDGRKANAGTRLPQVQLCGDFGFATSPVAPAEFDMRLGLPDKSTFPFDIWRRLSNRALRTLAKAPAEYLDPAGPEPLRKAIAGHVSFARAVACEPHDIVVTAGAQQAFDIIARTLVVPGETTIAVEEPGYPPLRAAFAAAGARVRPVPVDSDGLMVGKIPTGTRIVCVTPSHQFPTGVVMSLRRRQALLEFAYRQGAVIVEDDYDSEFRFGGRPLDALQTLDREGSVLYVGTFSKSLFPALRLGFVVAPTWVRAALTGARRLADWHGPALSQLTLAAFIEEGHLARHIRRMRNVYGERRAALLESLTRHCSDWLMPIPSESGLHLAARLAPGLSADVIVREALMSGVAVESLRRYATLSTTRSGLGFGLGLCPVERIDTAILRLRQRVMRSKAAHG